MTKFLDELKWRGLLHDVIPGTEELLKTPTTGYIGFDPTADSLHVGSLAQIITLIRFKNSGHTPIVLIGGATGMVGDPSGKSDERNLLDSETLNKNILGITKQLTKLIDCKVVNNYDWFKNFSFIDFIREAGKHITVNYMLSKDSVKKRIEGGNGMSFTEFTYQLIQGWDFCHLFKEHDCKLQMGGSDQWGNITTGTDFVHKKLGDKAFALTTQLIKKADGTKFGKTESGNIWLDANKTSPYKFYQFWLNSSDDDIINWVKTFSLKDQSEIEKLISEHNVDKGKRILQKSLAEELTILVHGQEALSKAISMSNQLFNGDITTLEENDFMEIVSDLDTFTISKNKIGSNIIDFLDGCGLYASKSDIRRNINAVLINKKKVDLEKVIDNNCILFDNVMLVQKGKKKYNLIKLV